jgi:hypothetical protein
MSWSTTVDNCQDCEVTPIGASERRLGPLAALSPEGSGHIDASVIVIPLRPCYKDRVILGGHFFNVIFDYG